MAFATEPDAVPHDHVVSLYDTDDELTNRIGHFAAEGLECGDTVVIIATAEHRAAVTSLLVDEGFDLDAARTAEWYIELDAESTLALILSGSVPDASRLDDVFGGIIARADGDGRSVRAFGEMVALLWDDGMVSAAIELESMWNGLIRAHGVSVHCAYAIAMLSDSDDLAATGRVCAEHSNLLTPTRYPRRTALTDAVPGDAMPLALTHLFVPAPSAIAAVRRFVTDALSGWNLDHLAADAALLASELATNAYLHASSPFRVTVRCAGDGVRLAVDDTSTTLPTPRIPTFDLVGGRGLAMVETIASRWGAERSADGKVVWAELDPTG